MSKHRYYNTTDSPYTMDAEGHVLGGGEHGVFESSNQIRLGLKFNKLLDKGEVEEDETEENASEVTVKDAAPSEPAEVETPKAKRTKSQNRTESQEK